MAAYVMTPQRASRSSTRQPRQGQSSAEGRDIAEPSEGTQRRTYQATQPVGQKTAALKALATARLTEAHKPRTPPKQIAAARANLGKSRHRGGLHRKRRTTHRRKPRKT